jgi:hypothetical protein
MALIISESYQHPNGTMEVKDFSNNDLITQSLHPNALPSPAYAHILPIDHVQMEYVYNLTNVSLLNNDS